MLLQRYDARTLLCLDTCACVVFPGAGTGGDCRCKAHGTRWMTTHAEYGGTLSLSESADTLLALYAGSRVELVQAPVQLITDGTGQHSL
jgi:hypothetical protein